MLKHLGRFSDWPFAFLSRHFRPLPPCCRLLTSGVLHILKQDMKKTVATVFIAVLIGGAATYICC